jgi:hypothetical protein
MSRRARLVLRTLGRCVIRGLAVVVLLTLWFAHGPAKARSSGAISSRSVATSPTSPMRNPTGTTKVSPYVAGGRRGWGWRRGW